MSKWATSLPGRTEMLKNMRYANGCHEAAHAVIAVLLGRRFKCVRLGERVPENLPSYMKDAVSMGQLVPTDEMVRRGDAFEEAMLHLAGFAFEKLLRPRHSYCALLLGGRPAGDFYRAIDWCIYGMGAPPDATSESFPEMANKAERLIFKSLLPDVSKLITENWGSITKVGAELADRGELSQRRVKTLMGR